MVGFYKINKKYVADAYWRTATCLAVLRRGILQDKKCARLAEMCCLDATDKPQELAIDRSALCFGAILSYYQTGELHIPPGVCLGAFRREMEYWQVEFDALFECCLYRYQAFLDEEETRRQFLHKALLPKSELSPMTTTGADGNIKKYKARLWNIMDNKEDTIAAKFYFVLVLLMVLLSIFVLAYSTEPSMRRRVSKCELLEYMKNIGSVHVQKVYETLGSPECSHTGSWIARGGWDYDDFDVYQYDWEYYEYSWGLIWDDLFTTSQEPPPVPPHFSATGPLPLTENSTSNTTLNLTSTDAPNVYDYAGFFPNFPREKPLKKKLDIPNLTVPKLPFDILDIIINVFFTFDFILRLISCPSLKRYFLSIINIFDALALLASYIFLIIVAVEKEYRYKESIWLNLLEFAQVFRALRLFRVVKNVRASKVLAYSLTQNVRDMTLLITLLFVGISTFACLFYFAESRETIPSIPNAWYWAVVTMTTVGYGDISPETGVGRVIASICAICGVLLLAITLPMFVNNFLTLYQYSCVTESIEKRKVKKNSDTVRNVENVSQEKDLVVADVDDHDKPPAYETPKKTIDNYSETVGNTVKLYRVKEACVK